MSDNGNTNGTPRRAKAKAPVSIFNTTPASKNSRKRKLKLEVESTTSGSQTQQSSATSLATLGLQSSGPIEITLTRLSETLCPSEITKQGQREGYDSYGRRIVVPKGLNSNSTQTSIQNRSFLARVTNHSRKSDFQQSDSTDYIEVKTVLGKRKREFEHLWRRRQAVDDPQSECEIVVSQIKRARTEKTVLPTKLVPALPTVHKVITAVTSAVSESKGYLPDAVLPSKSVVEQIITRVSKVACVSQGFLPDAPPLPGQIVQTVNPEVATVASVPEGYLPDAPTSPVRIARTPATQPSRSISVSDGFLPDAVSLPGLFTRTSITQRSTRPSVLEGYLPDASPVRIARTPTTQPSRSISVSDGFLPDAVSLPGLFTRTSITQRSARPSVLEGYLPDASPVRIARTPFTQSSTGISVPEGYLPDASPVRTRTTQPSTRPPVLEGYLPDAPPIRIARTEIQKSSTISSVPEGFLLDASPVRIARTPIRQPVIVTSIPEGFSADAVSLPGQFIQKEQPATVTLVSGGFLPDPFYHSDTISQTPVTKPAPVTSAVEGFLPDAVFTPIPVVAEIVTQAVTGVDNSEVPPTKVAPPRLRIKSTSKKEATVASKPKDSHLTEITKFLDSVSLYDKKADAKPHHRPQVDQDPEPLPKLQIEVAESSGTQVQDRSASDPSVSKRQSKAQKKAARRQKAEKEQVDGKVKLVQAAEEAIGLEQQAKVEAEKRSKLAAEAQAKAHERALQLESQERLKAQQLAESARFIKEALAVKAEFEAQLREDCAKAEQEEAKLLAEEQARNQEATARLEEQARVKAAEEARIQAEVAEREAEVRAYKEACDLFWQARKFEEHQYQVALYEQERARLATLTLSNLHASWAKQVPQAPIQPVVAARETSRKAAVNFHPRSHQRSLFWQNKAAPYDRSCQARVARAEKERQTRREVEELRSLSDPYVPRPRFTSYKEVSLFPQTNPAKTRQSRGPVAPKLPKRKFETFAEGEQDIERERAESSRAKSEQVLQALNDQAARPGPGLSTIGLDYSLKTFVSVKGSSKLAARSAYTKSKKVIRAVASEGQRYATATMFKAKRLCVQSLTSLYSGAGNAQQAIFGRGSDLAVVEDPSSSSGNVETITDQAVSNLQPVVGPIQEEIDPIQDHEWNDNPNMNRRPQLVINVPGEDVKESSKPIACDESSETSDEEPIGLSDESEMAYREAEEKDDIETGLQSLKLDERRRSMRLRTSARREELRIREMEEREKRAREERERLEREEKLKAERLGRIEPPKGHGFFKDLSTNLADRVEAAIGARSTKNVSKAVDGTPITGSDFQRLQPKKWLNDEIVNGAIGLYTRHAQTHFDGKKSKGTPTVQAMGSHFYTQMDKQGDGTIAGTHGKVARWASRKQIGGKAFLSTNLVLAPINHGDSHWTLLALWPKQKVVEHYDSFHGDASRVFDITKKFLQGELGPLYQDSEWSYRVGNSPRQANGYDCGVFTCTTAKMLILGYEPEVSYEAENMAGQRKRIAAELLTADLEGELESPFAKDWLR